MVSECGQGTLLNIMMASSKGAGGKISSAFHIVHVFSVSTVIKWVKSSRMLSPFLPLMRKLTGVEGFDYTC